MHPIAGKSGNIYNFEIYNLESFPDISNCIYIYMDEHESGYSPTYIGMTTRSIKVRYAEHNNDGVNECVGFYGAKFMFIHHNETPLSEDELKYIEDDLLNKYKTPCNKINN